MTAVMPTEQVPRPQGPIRVPTIGVDLMPPEVVAGRLYRRVRAAVVSGLVLVLVLLGGWYAWARHQTSGARGQLTATQSDVQHLKNQQKTFDTLVKTQADTKAIDGQLTRLMANDLQWSALFTETVAALPTAAGLTSISASLNDANSTTKGLPAPSGVKVVGTLTVSGVAASKRVVAAYLDSMAKLKDLTHPMLTSVTDDTNGVQFVAQFDLTDAVLAGRYSPGPSASAGSK